MIAENPIILKCLNCMLTSISCQYKQINILFSQLLRSINRHETIEYYFLQAFQSHYHTLYTTYKHRSGQYSMVPYGHMVHWSQNSSCTMCLQGHTEPLYHTSILPSQYNTLPHIGKHMSVLQILIFLIILQITGTYHGYKTWGGPASSTQNR